MRVLGLPVRQNNGKGSTMQHCMKDYASAVLKLKRIAGQVL